MTSGVPATGSAVFIGTTEGPVEILSILRETGDPPSAVFLNGGTSKMRISAAYREFIEKPSGFVERICGHRAFRTDLSGRIDGGESWQLGMLVAHIVETEKRLVRQAEQAGRVIWCSGSVRNVPGSASDIVIGRIDSLPQKLQLSAELFRAAEARGADVWVVLSEEDDSPQVRRLIGQLCASARVVTFGRIPLAEFTGFWSRVDKPAAADSLNPAVSQQTRTPGARSFSARPVWLVGAVLLAAGVGALAYYATAGTTPRESPPPAASVPPQREPPRQNSPASARPAPVTATSPKSDAASSADWSERVEVKIQAMVAKPGESCLSASAAQVVEPARKLKEFRAAAIDGRLCGGRVIVANQTESSVVVSLSGLKEASGGGVHVVEPHGSGYLILGPAHKDARITVRPQNGGDFSAPLFTAP